MQLHRTTWMGVVAAAVIFLLLNLKSWQPGLGGRTDVVDGVRPPGSELELFYGWPACYRAELLRSDDPALTDRLLKSAPFFRTPYDQMRVAAQYQGWWALLLDAVFALVSIALLVVYLESNRRKHWTQAALLIAIGLLLFLGAAYNVADRVSVHL